MDSRRFDADSVSFSWATWTDVGKRRTINEDSLLALPGLFVVADGMGGHGGGDVASKAAVEALADGREAPFDVDEIPQMLADARVAVDGAARADRLTMMGTTLVALMWVVSNGRDRLVVANVGDSRCYELGPAGLQLVTRDHSVVQELIEAGDLAPSEADQHPDRHVVTRALGGGSTGTAEYVALGPTAPHRLLLCSDGVSGELDHTEIAECLDLANTPVQAVEALAARVLDGSATDNATAIVVDVEWDTAVLMAAADVGGDTRPHPQRVPSGASATRSADWSRRS